MEGRDFNITVQREKIQPTVTFNSDAKVKSVRCVFTVRSRFRRMWKYFLDVGT